MSVTDLLHRSTTRTSLLRPVLAACAVLAGYAALILVAHLWGEALRAAGIPTGLHAPPLFGDPDPFLTARLLPPVLLAVLIVAFGDRIAARLSWKGLLAASFAGSSAWAVAIAGSRGWAALTDPLGNRFDTFAFLPGMPPTGEFLRTFIDRMPGYPIHVKGHPPGLPLLLRAMESVELARPGVVAALLIGAGASAVPAVLYSVRRLASEKHARLAAPWLVLAPFALWIATSNDALYAGVAAWGVALSLPGERPQRWRPLAGGLLLGCSVMLTYGAAAIGAIPLLAAVARRSYRHLAYVGAGGVAVIVAFVPAGFWWFDGLFATRVEYFRGLGGVRPYGFFLFSNLAALAIAVGPAALRGLAGLRNPLASTAPATAAPNPTAPATAAAAPAPAPPAPAAPAPAAPAPAAPAPAAPAPAAPAPAAPAAPIAPAGLRGATVLTAGALVAVGVANLSGLSKGEVERIWLLFMPWIVVAAAGITGGRRFWLAASATSALVVQTLVVMPW
ncbi:MAG: hypothetical protein ACT4OM_03070 [Actinomycetota bacterium]